ncbi:MAG: ribonuclease III [Clostridiales bacterium]|jgi:ribonuclease-3 family protein|nr:ribonuclease III [Clostridiales bacterium]
MHKDINNLSASALAFVGDAVFTLFVRQFLALQYDKKGGGLHALQSKFVSAKAQSKMSDQLYDKLSQQEQDIFNRCRNAHVDNKTKAATFKEYKKATGLEGLFGSLYLNGQNQRLQELCEFVMTIV